MDKLWIKKKLKKVMNSLVIIAVILTGILDTATAIKNSGKLDTFNLCLKCINRFISVLFIYNKQFLNRFIVNLFFME